MVNLVVWAGQNYIMVRLFHKPIKTIHKKEKYLWNFEIVLVKIGEEDLWCHLWVLVHFNMTIFSVRIFFCHSVIILICIFFSLLPTFINSNKWYHKIELIDSLYDVVHNGRVLLTYVVSDTAYEYKLIVQENFNK